jgi:hypothetical protein
MIDGAVASLPVRGSPSTCMVINRCKVQGPASLLQSPSDCWLMAPKVLGHPLSWWLVLHFRHAWVWWNCGSQEAKISIH